MKIISLKTLKKTIFIIVLICGIIGINNAIYTNDIFGYKVVKSPNYGLATNIPEYEICTDALMYHISANGYDKRIDDPCNDNFSIAGVGSSNSLKAKGYGWYTYKLKSLQGLIEYCHSKNPLITEDKSNITIGTEPYTVEYDYNSLVNLSERTLSKISKDIMKRFWEGMYNEIENEFKEYQDSYFFKENTLKAIDKIRGTLNSEGLEANNLSERNLSKNRTMYPEESKKEYLTLLTTYMYSINREEKLASVGKGDLVPFLYYAEHTGETNPYEICKYAYVALCAEFLRVSGTNYWKNEFNKIYNMELGSDELQETENFVDWVNDCFLESKLFEEDIETLEAWYDETYEKYKNDRGAKQNPLIGSDIDTIIGSNYTINYQVEATKDYVESIYAEIGIDMTADDFIARNALMAEYMMQNSNFDDVIKDYNVSIKFTKDNLRRGTFEEKNGTTAVLSDFQMIEFNDTIEKVANEDKDEDGITNKVELGNTKWQDITGFVEKTYIDKYGTNMAMYESKVYEMVINNGGYIDFNGNFVFGHVKMEKDLLGNIKVFYKVYDYKSNPVLKDTDFDGMDDAADSRPKDNKFHGTAKIERNQNLKVDYHNDYRHFYIDNNKYNSELAEMSLIISNLANDENRKLHIYQGGDSRGIPTAGRLLIGDMTITQYLSKIGFIPLGNIPLYDGDGKCYLYYKIINYYGEEKLVFGIFIGGFNNERAYRELVVNNDGNKYQSIINAITNQVKALKGLNAIKDYFNNNKYCYWITGKNISGAIATGVASELGDEHNTYCYTYGVPNVKGMSTLTYIKNIVNEDDLLPKIYKNIGQEGDVYNKSIYWDLIPEYKYYVENPNKYKGNFKRTNNVRDSIKNVKDKLDGDNTLVEFNNGLTSYLYNLLEEREGTVSEETISNNDNITEEVSELIRYKDEVSSGNSTKAYWCLVKSLDGYDSKYYYTSDNNVVYDKNEEKAPSSDENKSDNENYITFDSTKDVLMNLAKYYINTINTHEGTNYSERANDLANGENGASKHIKGTYGSGDNKLSEYEYDVLKKLPDIRDNEYYVKNSRIFGNTQNYNFNLRPYNTGDSCSDFALTAIRMLSNGYRGEPTDSYDKKSDKKANDDYGLYLHNTYSLIMQGINEEQKDLEESNKRDRHGAVGSLSFERAMTRLGYEKIYVTDDMTVDDLEVGDILVSNKHTEFYIGTNFETIYVDMRNGTINDWKKSGIVSITESGSNQPADNGKLYGTFGWGGVHDEFPVESSDNKLCYFYKYADEAFFRHCECGNDPNKIGTDHTSSQCKFSDEEHQYKIIWRKQ